MAENKFSLFRDQKLKWVEQISENDRYEVWRASAFELNPPHQYLITVFKRAITDPEEELRFTETLSKVSTIRHHALLPILGFSVAEPLTHLPTIFYEFCSGETVSNSMRTLTKTEKLVVICGIACASQTFEGKGLNIGPVFAHNVFLNSENEPKICNYGIPEFVSDESAIVTFGETVFSLMSLQGEEDEEGCGSQSMPGFFVDLCAQCDMSYMNFELVVRSFMSEGFIVEGADARIIHDYQVRVISPEFSKRIAIDMYQQNRIHRSQIDELQSTIDFLADEIRKVKKSVKEAREEDTLIYELAQETQTMRNKVKDMSSKLKKYLSVESNLVIPLSIDKGGIFQYLIKSQKSPFKKSVIASQSSGDVYCIINEKDPGNYSSGSSKYEWVQFEFPKPITINGIKIQSAHRAFMKNWGISAIDDNGHTNTLYRTTDDAGLNGIDKILMMKFTTPYTSKIFRIEKFGPNWSGTNFARIKNVEIFSPTPGFEEGVFKKLLEMSGGDPHKADVIVTASNFDFRHFHILSPPRSMCTLFDKDEFPWMQFELTGGSVLLHGYRMQQLDDYLFDKWSVQGSNDGEEWEVIDRKTETSSNPLKVIQVEATKTFRMFRVVCEMEDSETVKLRMRHFDVFGVYFDKC